MGHFSVFRDTRLFLGVMFLMLVLACPTGLSSDPMHFIHGGKDTDQSFFSIGVLFPHQCHVHHTVPSKTDKAPDFHGNMIRPR